MNERKEVNTNFKKTINIISIIISIILLLFFIVLTYNVFKINILPLKYSILLFTIEIILLSIICTFLLKKNIKWKIKVFLIILSLLLIIISCCGNGYIGNTLAFFKNITENNVQTENYNVVVLKDSSYNNINDLKDKKVEYIEIGSIQEALTKLEEKITIKQIKAESLTDLSIDLMNKETDAIYLTDSNKELLEEENEEFKNNIKVIETIALIKDNEIESEDINITTEPFHILISGIDTYGEISTVARSDVNIIATINPKSKEVLLTSIPRDYYVELAKFNKKDKLTHSGFYGTDITIGTIEKLFDIKINYYLRVNFSTLINLVDVLGGITINSDYTFTSSSGPSFKKGENFVNGEQALAFSRERYSFIDGDRQRGKNQQIVIKSIVSKMVSPAILNKYSDVLKTLEGTFQTNMKASDIQELIKFQIDKMPNWNISSINLNGSDSYDYTYTFGNQKLYVMIPNEKTVNKAKSLIQDAFDGKTIDISKMN